MIPEIKVVKVEVGETIHDIGKDASKQLSSINRYRFYREVVYFLENGVSIPSRITGITKPKLQQWIESTKNNIALNMMFAQQYDHGNGPYWSFLTKYYIGPR